MASLTPEQRELNLVLKLELRLGNADSDEKLQALLHTYLAPLILKLASDHVSVRNKVIGACQYVNRRLKTSTAISLPVPTLLKQFRQAENGFVKQFDLLYIQQGLERLSATDGVAILPEVLQISVPEEKFQLDSTEGKTWSLAFHFLLRLLRSWKLPDRLSKEGVTLKDEIGLSDSQSGVLAAWLYKFLLYDGRTATPSESDPSNTSHQMSRRSAGLSELEQTFLSAFDEVTQDRPSAAQFQLVKAKVASFLFTSIFNDADRFVPAVVLTSDTSNIEAFRIGDMMFKQCDFDLENQIHVDDLFSLYEGAKPKIQIRISALLARSKQATKRTADILKMIESQLGSGTEGLEATKLRTALFNLLDWTIKIGEDQELRAIGPAAQKVMRDFIEVQGWPSPIHAVGEGNSLSPAQLDLRQKAYSCIGTLTTKSQPDIEMFKFLFTSLRCDSSSGEVHANVNEALGRAVNSFSLTDESSMYALKALLVESMTAEVGQEDSNGEYVTAWDTHFATVKCANRCLPFSDVDARYIDLLAIGTSNSQEVVEEGSRGLDLYLHSTGRGLSPDLRTATMVGEVMAPRLGDLVERVFGSKEGDMPKAMLAAAVTFCRNIVIVETLQNAGKPLDLEPEWKRHLNSQVSTDGETRKLIRTNLGGKTVSNLPSSSIIKLVKAAIHGMSIGLEECAEISAELCSLAPNSVLSALDDVDVASCERAAFSTNVRVQESAARAFGILYSLLVTGKTSYNTMGDSYLRNSFEKLQDWNNAIGQSVVGIRGVLRSLAFSLTRTSLRGGTMLVAPQISSFALEIQEIISVSRDEGLKDAACLSVAQLSLCEPSAFALEWNPNKLLDSMLQSAKKEKEIAVNATGRLIRFMSLRGDEDFVSEALEKLYALHEIRKPELHFAVGEALAVAVAGWNSTSTVAEFDVDTGLPADPVSQGLLSTVLARSMQDCQKTKPSLRKAAAIWLLCLVQYCGKEEALRSQLRSCQAAFARLLTDRDEVVQESGSRGLSLVFEMGDAAIREDLVRDLVHSFTGSNAKMSGSVTEETQLFEEGALPTEGGASVTTYKDIVSLASEMGDPSLVYRFMNLASNNAIWTTRAAFGRFGLSNILADSSYLSENKKFYPKLYRYRFDPNPNVQRSMNEIWKALVKNPSAVIDENFDLIIRDLLKSILGKEWRVREASCSALADLVQDRDVERYEKYLKEIWGVAFKVMDDIKESVRAAALKLCRTLTNLLIRNLEVGDGMTKRASVLLEHALTFLLQQFGSGGAKEVQAYAISSLLEVVKKCPPKAMRPHAPVLLESLIMSLSSLEHESINYLHLNADKYGLTAEKLDKMRVSGVNASPVTDCIDRCLESLDTRNTDDDPEAVNSVKDAMRRLEVAFKESIGLPSKVGLSRVIVTLVVRHNLMFRPYVGRFVQLTRKSVVDRNPTISVSFAMSLAYLMRLASEKQVQETYRFAKELYFNSEQSSNRALAGEIVQATSKVSNDVFMRFATSFLPFAFVGRNDTEADVRERFDATWKENVGGTRSINLYLPEIVELIQGNIKSLSWAVKHGCCLSVADLVESMEVQGQYTNVDAGLIWPILEEALAGKTWNGKEKVVLAYPKFVKKARCLWEKDHIGRQMGQIALREAKRTNVAYRPHAIEALGQFVLARSDLDLSLEIATLLAGVMEDLTADEADHMEIDAGADAGKHASKDIVETTMSVSVVCLFQMLQPYATSAVLKLSKSIAENARKSGFKSTRIALYEGAKLLIDKVSAAEEGKRGKEEKGEEKEEDHRGEMAEKEIEVFSSKTAAALLEDNGPVVAYEDDSENIRGPRVKLALALAQSYVACAAQPQLGRPRGKLAALLKVWLQKERSRSLTDDLHRAILALDSLEAREHE